MELLTHHDFVPLVGVAFVIALPAANTTDTVVALHLVSVTPLAAPQRLSDAGESMPVADGPARQEPFSLQFRGPLNPPLGQGTYRMTPEPASASVSTPVPAALDIFIVPIGRDVDGYRYEAIFG